MQLKLDFVYDNVQDAFIKNGITNESKELWPYIFMFLQKKKDDIQRVLELSTQIKWVQDQFVWANFPRNYTDALIKVVLKKKLFNELVWLIDDSWYLRWVKAVIKKNQEMKEDGYGFYLKNKGNSKFPRFWSLSLGYSRVSLAYLLQKIVKDVEKFKKAYEWLYSYHSTARDPPKSKSKAHEDTLRDVLEFIVGGGRDIEDDDIGNFSRLRVALVQDIRSTWLPDEVLEELEMRLKIKEKSERKTLWDADSQQDFLEAFFCYFSFMDAIPAFIEKRKSGEQGKQELITDFTIKYHNDPHVNPRLIGMSPSQLGTKEFEKRYQTRANQEYKDKDGLKKKRRDIIDDGTMFADQYY